MRKFMKNGINLVRYGKRLYGLVLLSDIDESTNKADVVILFNRARVVIDMDLSKVRYITYLQQNTIKDIKFYKVSINNMLDKYGKTKESVYKINKYLSEDKRAITMCDYVLTLGLSKEVIDIDTRYHTLISLDIDFLSHYISRVERKVLYTTIEQGLKNNKLDDIIYKSDDMINVVGNYDFSYSWLNSVGHTTKSILNGTCICKKGHTIGYHFRNFSYDSLEEVIYDEIDAELDEDMLLEEDDDDYSKTILYNWQHIKGNSDTLQHEDLGIFEVEESIDDLYGNLGNVVVLADLIYAINRYERNIEIDFKTCYFLSLLSIRGNLLNRVIK